MGAGTPRVPGRAAALYPYTDSGYPVVNPDTPTYDPWVVVVHRGGDHEDPTGDERLHPPLRHPLQTARSVVTLDRVSGARHPRYRGGCPTSSYLNVGFKDRGRRTDAAITAIQRLWSEDVIEVHDEFFDFGP